MTDSSSSRRSWLTAIGMVFLLLLVPATAPAEDLALWTTFPQKPCPSDPLSHVARRCVVVEVRRAVLADVNINLKLSLPDGSEVIASKIESPQLGGRSSIWHGSINGKSFS